MKKQSNKPECLVQKQAFSIKYTNIASSGISGEGAGTTGEKKILSPKSRNKRKFKANLKQSSLEFLTSPKANTNAKNQSPNVNAKEYHEFTEGMKILDKQASAPHKVELNKNQTTPLAATSSKQDLVNQLPSGLRKNVIMSQRQRLS